MTKTSQIAVAVSVGIFAMGLHTARAATRTYPTGSLIVPMDTTYQNSGMLKAYGLVYKLLSNGVPIDWIIKPGKTYSQSDVTIDFRNITTMATGTHAYRGGPFVIDVANRAVALPIIQAWQSVNPNFVAHEATAAFTADVGRSLVAAPRMAVLADGNENIAFGYLTAAGIPDSRGAAWPTAGAPPGYVDILFPSEVAGPTTTNHRDGLLFDANGTPRFSLLMSMHWAVSTGTQDEAIAEIKEFLKSRNLVFAECQAATTLENKGLLLTDLGLTIQRMPTGVNHFFNDHPLAQADGAFGTVGGSEPAFLPAGVYLGTEGTEYHRLLRGTSSVDVLEAGYAFQNTAAGRVVYLGGHQYSTNLPISVNPTTNGVRHFLNALLFAPATALGDGAADLSATLSRPASPTTNPDMDFSITYRNAGLGAALDTQVVVPIPAGTTASMVSGGGSVSGGQIVWTLGNLADGQPSPSGTLSFRLTAALSETFTVTATASYKRGITPVSTSSTAVVTYKFATTSALSSSANPSGQGQPVTFTATVTSSSGAPTGTVTFKDGNTTLGMAGLSGASPYQAMFTTSTLTAGTHSITAMYGGDANFDQSTSPLLSQGVLASFGPPPGLTATAMSTTTVNVTWLPVSGADHYEIFSRSNSAPFALRGRSGTNQFADFGLAPATTYLYEVRAVSASGTMSAFSNIDLATTVIFTDDPLTVASTAVKAVHLNELRQAVKAMRLTAGLSEVTFTGSIDATVTTIQAVHINQLRSALSEARTAFALASGYTDDPVVAGSTAIKAIHVQEIRDAVK